MTESDSHCLTVTDLQFTPLHGSTGTSAGHHRRYTPPAIEVGEAALSLSSFDSFKFPSAAVLGQQSLQAEGPASSHGEYSDYIP